LSGHEPAIWVLILAAGRSRRMGVPKQLLPIHGESLLRRVARNVSAVPGLAAAVVGTDDPDMKAECADLPLRWIVNPNPDEGLSGSIRAGTAEAQAHGADAVMIVLGDQPDLSPAVLALVRDAYRSRPAPILQTRYAGGRPGHPVLFDRSMFGELLQLKGDAGAKALIERRKADVAPIEAAAPPPVDLDTWEDYERYIHGSCSERREGRA